MKRSKIAVFVVIGLLSVLIVSTSFALKGTHKASALTGFEIIEPENVSLSDVDDVKVVTDTGAIFCGVIRTKNIQLFPLPKGGAQDDRDQVRFVSVRLSEILRCSRGVEIPE